MERAHFLMVGDGPLRPPVQRRITRYGLDRRFTLPGFRTDADRLWDAADVAVVCSRREACSLAALEAMAAGLPVVATPVGDLPHQVVHGRTGYLAPGDAGVLARAVLALSDPCLRARLGRAGHARVAAHYSLDRMVDRTLDLYPALQLRPETEMIPAGGLLHHP
jgi:glycosyltransferase involved in cell wall biosynthesis